MLNVATYAAFIDMNLSGADNTTSDRTNAALKIDLDSSANGDAGNEHRIHGVDSDVRFTGFSDIARGGYFYTESNYTGGKTAQLVGVYGNATHDANSTSGGVSNMYGVFGTSSIQDLGDVDNAFGGYFSVTVSTSRGDANVGVTKGVEGEIQIDKNTTIDYDTMIGVSSVIDNNEGSTPNFGTQYLFKGDYQGTKGSNAYGIHVAGDKNYFEGNVGIGTTSPALQSAGKGLHINATTSSELKFTNSSTGSTASDGTALVSNGNNFTINNREAGTLSLGTSNQVRLLINSSGYVGIGTTSAASELDVNGVTTSKGFRTDTSNTNYNLITRNSTSNTLYVQAAQSNSTQPIASFRYGSATANGGTETLRIRKDNINVFGANFTVDGSITGNSKNFSIKHPTKEGKRLVHSCLEGPEVGVYFRGRSKSNIIEMPDYWGGLVHLDSMTVDITAIGPNQDLYVEDISDDGKVTVGSNTEQPLNYFYVVYGERKDIGKLDIEVIDAEYSDESTD